MQRPALLLRAAAGKVGAEGKGVDRGILGIADKRSWSPVWAARDVHQEYGSEAESHSFQISGLVRLGKT